MNDVFLNSMKHAKYYLYIKKEHMMNCQNFQNATLRKVLPPILSCLDNYGLFIDLRKAFDGLDHNILLKKLKCYGIYGVSDDFLRFYISDRS